MADGSQPVSAALLDSVDGGAILFVLAGDRYALPLSAVEAIVPPPALCRVPHAAAPLLGAGNLGGQVLPVIDLAEVLPGKRPQRRYDGGGEVLRVQVAGGSVGVWIDRVERFLVPGSSMAEGVTMIDPEPLVKAGMVAPSLAPDSRFALGDASEIVARSAPATAEVSYFLVEAAGERARLAREAVLEFLEAPAWVAVPGAPPGFLGVSIVRGDALPVLSLASLLGLPGNDAQSFAIVALHDHNHALLGFDRVVGLRTHRRQTGRRWVDQTLDVVAGASQDGRIFDLATMLPEELRRIVSGFALTDTTRGQDEPIDGLGAAQYLSFVVGGQNYALPVSVVDRVISAQRLIALPQLPGGNGAIVGAVDLRGQLVPVARLEASVAERHRNSSRTELGAYVIIHGAAGLMAVGVERVERLIALRPDQITPAPGAGELFDGVAVLDEAGDLVRILASDRIGQDG